MSDDKKIQRVFQVGDSGRLRALSGPIERNLKAIGAALGTQIAARGTAFYISADSAAAATSSEEALRRLLELSDGGTEIDEALLAAVLDAVAVEPPSTSPGDKAPPRR